jgi:cation diffusion facilitator CzcD-associated flavoprotein CzcO/short-subunit dehydrogenase
VSPELEHFDALIIGAGISGIDNAYRLKERNPRLRYLILESRVALGGTWDLFRYPGVRSDSDIATLGFPFRPFRGDKAIVDGATIWQYVKETAQHYGIDRRIRYGHRVVAADWSSADARWTVTCEVAGKRVTFTCGFLLGCAGYYAYANGHAPEWPGMDAFAGRLVHPQFWPNDLDATDKQVVVVGSGATAVTIVPAMSQDAAHVTMLQRSPSYMAALPSRDELGNKLRTWLPRRMADALVRWKNIGYSAFVYRLARTQPDRFRALLRGGVLQALGSAYDPKLHDVDVHFNPSYKPWDQRLCLVADGDLFAALRKGRASIVTGSIAEFTPAGIRLESGQELPADIVVSATGLEMQFLGGVELRVDGDPVDVSQRLVYKGTMIEGVPNFAFSFGYTHSSWTLKVDLNARYVAKLLQWMRRRSYASATPTPASNDIRREPLMSLTSGYVQRALSQLPRRGPLPWDTHDNYIKDLFALLTNRIDDGTLRFAKAPAKAKLVLVTGGGAGIGRAIALAFARRGANIVLTDVDANGLSRVRSEVEALGVRCSTFVADVADEAAMRQLGEDVAADAGVPDVLVNNAGIAYLGSFLKSPPEHWHRMLDVNVIGIVNCCYYFVPKMLAAGGKRRVVIIASGASHYPPPNAAAYGASKAAAFSFGESLKMELAGTGIGVTTVCPGITNTGIIDRPRDASAPPITEAQFARLRDYYAKKGATPEAVAESVVRGVERGSDVVLVGPASRLIYNLRRISLPLTRRLTYGGARDAGFR